MLVIADSGGAASDIYAYCCPDSPRYKKPIAAGGNRDPNPNPNANPNPKPPPKPKPQLQP